MKRKEYCEYNVMRNLLEGIVNMPDDCTTYHFTHPFFRDEFKKTAKRLLCDIADLRKVLIQEDPSGNHFIGGIYDGRPVFITLPYMDDDKKKTSDEPKRRRNRKPDDDLYVHRARKKNVIKIV